MKRKTNWNELGEEIPTREAKRLLQDTSTSELTEFSVDVVRAFQLADGRVLFVVPFALPERRVFAWHSREHFQRYFDSELAPKLDRAPESRHILADRQCGRRGFVDDVPRLCASLPGQLGIDVGRLDYMPKSFARIDRALRDVDPDEILADPLFSALCAYAGETIRQSCNGQWQMVPHAREAEIWIPCVVAGSRRINFVVPLNDAIIERGPGLRLTILSLIGA